ncbi:hypothetical protein [Burkholderia multivorans]|uniref:hypothetical protein n=1 Tax=Burkholderia multivorans TaxID=87883 RepID=UPI00158984D7|nr:hypothetical protein [Burkholderia multivorans]MDR8877289.1 hypothetical protein [Burkholderia multivorans]MDR8882451.1 hypothetical protein [Burkholderia multivorans]MDR8889488.1 hypothetical protein [Burkholderia multivorans]MDR8908242.1 hypothetical protein [Burkholderia multivorans]MDR8915121.1 hypothetical protein [Burkholderia multivorans]
MSDKQISATPGMFAHAELAKQWASGHPGGVTSVVQAELGESEPKHKAIFGSTREGMTRLIGEVRKPSPKCSGLLAALLFRQ